MNSNSKSIMINSQNPQVSLVIPCYNHGLYIDEAVKSVLEQSYKNIEIIIVNDGSTDEHTINILNKYEKKKPRVIHINNQGPSIARNNGIKISNGKYILPLDADDKIGSTYVEKAVEVLEQNKNIGIVYCEAELFGQKIGKWELPEYHFPEILLGNVIFSTALFRKSDWEKVNGYNPNMIYGWEDFDFWLSLIELGREVFRIPEVLFFYRQLPGSRNNSMKPEYVVKSYTQLFKNHPKLYSDNIEIIFNYITQLRAKNWHLQTQLQADQAEMERTITKVYFASILVPWWDHSEFLELWKRNLEHLPNTEIIFIDNGSGPVGKAALEEFCRKHNIKLIRNAENRGFAAANNQGLEVATGEYILHLNNDVEILNPLVNHLCAYAGNGIAGPGPIQNEIGQIYIEGWALCIKRSTLQALGGWCEDYGPGYWDDVDLCYRAQLAGYSLTPVPYIKNLIRHQGNATGRDGRIDQLALHICNRGIFINKYYFVRPKIIVDGVFFQLYQTGIGRVWHSLLEEWADNGFAKHIVVLDRAGTAPAIPGIRYRPVPPYDYGKTDADREMLQQVCDEEGAGLFISSYYTTPLSTPSVFMAHDMIPELMGWDLNHPMWREKHYGIQHATAYIAVSENTARDLVKVFPDIALESVTVAKNGVDRKIFSPALPEKISRFKTKYGISKPYFILVGSGGYKNTILFFKAFAQLFSKHGFEIVCTGSGWLLETELRNYTSGTVVHMLQLSDEELSIAYSGAVALVYPSKYEGFGLPVLEAIACGCPVITCPNASIPEVAGEAALYVNDDDVARLTNALCDVQKPNIRNSLIAAGLEQAKNFSWLKMAKTVSSALIDATLLPLNLKDINLIVFPDWCQPEESLGFELEQVIKALATHPDSSQITLLVDNGKIPDDEATLILSSVSMNLLLQEDLDVSEGPEISLVGQLSEMQWEALLPRIHARIVLENENQGAIAQLKAETIPFCEVVSFSNEQAAQLKPGIWDITGHSEIIYFNRGMALRKQGKIAEAVSSYQKALEIKPDFAEASYQLSLARYENQIISKGYQFTQDWFSFNIPILEQHLKRFINIHTLNLIEIGSWEGRSSCWLIDNIMTHKSNKITCIDTFEGSIEHVQIYKYENSYIQSIEGRFDFNIVRTGVPEKVQKIVGKSNEVMRTLPLSCYDIAYIDGSHIASDVLEDAVLVWQLVKVGGFIIFDDYFFSFTQNPDWNTKIGIDAFMMSFKDKFRVIHKAEQVILEKTCL